jgi:peroxiredoxin
LIASLLFLTLSLTACSPEAPRLNTGDPAPGFELQRLDGDGISFPADLSGRVVAIRFWADWCPFCEGEMRSIEPVFRTFRDQGLAVLAVNVRQDPATASRFVESLGISYDVLLDEDGAVARDYGVSALPTTFFVDRSGKLVTRILGESTPSVFERIVGDML